MQFPKLKFTSPIENTKFILKLHFKPNFSEKINVFCKSKYSQKFLTIN